MNPSTRLHLQHALEADATNHALLLGAAARAPTSEQRDVLRTAAQRLLTQCLGHLDLLGNQPVDLTGLPLGHYASLARELGDDDEAEWLETVARANATHAERIAEVTP